MTTFNANDVLAVALNAHPRAGVWFLNWNIKAKPITERLITSAVVTVGAGLYGLYFDDQLIYIGSYLGNDPLGANFSGDVVSSRWWTHIGSITARGDRLHVAPTSLRALRHRLLDHHVMTAGFLSATDPQMLHRDAGNLAPLRRLLFAARHHDVFLTQNVSSLEVLARFKFVYVRIENMPQGMNASSLKTHIETAEKGLIKRFSPICNSTHLPADAPPEDICCADLETLLSQALKAPESPDEVPVENQHPLPVPLGDAMRVPAHEGYEPQEADGDLAQGFFDHLPQEPHASRTIVDCLVGLARRCGAEISYTGSASGDVRFLTTTLTGRSRVFMTLSWQSRAQRFLVRSQCSTEQARTYLGELGASESITDTMPSEPQRSQMKLTAELSKIAALRHVFLQARQVTQQL